MKKIIFCFLVFAVLVPLAAFGGRDENIRLPVSLTTTGGWDDDISVTIQKYEYDTQDRLVKIETYYRESLYQTITITYESDDFIKVIEDNIDSSIERYFNICEYDGIIITTNDPDDFESRIELNWFGYISRTETIYSEAEDEISGNPVVAYHYLNGNLLFSKGLQGPFFMGTEYFHYYVYDDKKSPYNNCKTPKWLLQYFLGVTGFENNVIFIHAESHHSEDTARITYEYDSDGYPVKRIIRGSFVEYVEEVYGYR